MKFGPVAVSDALGSYLAHAVKTGRGTFRKGTRLTGEHLEAIAEAGLTSIIAAKLDPDDLHEDEAAALIAAPLVTGHIRADLPATGRVNLFADRPGLLVVNREAVDAVNAINPAITLATRQPLRGVETGRMVATVKIIPFAVSQAAVDKAVAALRQHGPAISVEPYHPRCVAVVSTMLPALKSSTIDKTLGVLKDRLAPSGSSISADIRVPHDETALASALAGLGPEHDLVIIFGASAVVDREDVIPAAIELAGGSVDHLGMPVDPGNLLILGHVGARPVIGAPGCARSPAENGFDFILERLLAGHRVTAGDIMGMGVGGLLMDIVSRPSPRSGEALIENPDRPQISAVILAAGRSSRFADGHKLLADHRGKPLIRHAAEAALAAKVSEVVVVTGHRADEVTAALAGLDVRFVPNNSFAEGQATSVKTGLAAVNPASEAAIVLLGDMPGVTTAVIDGIIDAYRPAAGAYVVVPTHDGKRGNPVLWSRRYFAAISALSGDQGARAILETAREATVTVEAGPGVLFDVDTVESLAALARGDITPAST